MWIFEILQIVLGLDPEAKEERLTRKRAKRKAKLLEKMEKEYRQEQLSHLWQEFAEMVTDVDEYMQLIYNKNKNYDDQIRRRAIEEVFVAIRMSRNSLFERNRRRNPPIRNMELLADIYFSSLDLCGTSKKTVIFAETHLTKDDYREFEHRIGKLIAQQTSHK